MRWSIAWEQGAVDSLLNLARTELRQAERIASAVRQFGRAGVGDFRMLKGTPGLARLRVGDWRIILDVSEEATAVVVTVTLRRDAYD